ncbi:hypothetical protein MNBD_PLANCTO02-2688 [hydrothermal vent metagenome]|uniref:HMA domain-containing protein n=1 Tax=hydrothermal vent metagenome TaxID=652676 RepID=A0A3B1DPI1_9ZZZZ
MTSETNPRNQFLCPSCHQNGKRVSTVTLSGLLNEKSAQLFKTKNDSCCNLNEEGCKSTIANTGWRFCDTKDCDIVYFSEVDDTVFNKSDLKVSVGVKEVTGERPLCYCFGHSVDSIKEELKTNGSSNALSDIRAKMKNPGCRCEIENPSGSCCLGSVTQGIAIAQKELGMDDTIIKASATLPENSNKGEKISKVGMVLSAMMASSCCWLPLLLLAMGVSGAGIASTLEAYRPLFMVVTFSFLGAAFYFTYRPKKSVVDSAESCCATQSASEKDCCASSGKGRFNIMSLNKVMLWGVTVMAIAFLFFPSYVGAFLGGDEKTVTENMAQSVIKIEGMTCESCSKIAEKAIQSVSKVQAVEVSFEKGEALIGTEICCPVPKKAIQEALAKVGYTGTFIDSKTTISLPASASKKSCCVLPKPNKANSSSPLSHKAGETLVQTLFKIEGMTCESCAESLTKSITKVSGVKDVKIDFKKGIATVKHNSCCEFSADAVIAVVEKSGFKAVAVKEKTKS